MKSMLIARRIDGKRKLLSCCTSPNVKAALKLWLNGSNSFSAPPLVDWFRKRDENKVEGRIRRTYVMLLSNQALLIYTVDCLQLNLQFELMTTVIELNWLTLS
jgi:mannitol-specific phosphotransferase system IIBC component